MADNITVDNGALTDYPVAAEDATHSGDSLQLVQLIKLVGTSGSEGSRTIVPVMFAEATAHASGDLGFQLLGVRNDAAADRAGTDGDYAPIAVDAQGNVRILNHRDTLRISVASAGLTIATTAYTAGDQVGTQFTLANAARKSGGTGRIRSVLLISAADIIGAYDVVFTRASITLAADNAAYAISDTDALQIVQLVQLGGAFDIGNNRIAQASGLDIPYDCSGGTSLFASLITRIGHTFFAAVGNLQLVVFVERD